MEHQVDAFLSVTIGFVVFFIGAFLTRKIAFLQDFNIPEPVSGGLAVAMLTGICYAFTDIEITFDLAVRDYLLVVFFVTIGLNARFSDLVAGGRLLAILLVLTLTYILIQNTVGLVGTTLFGLPSALSVLLGSASLIGGHGTAIAWGPTISEATGFEAAAEIGVAAATVGLVCAALIGGPIAKYLINRDHLSADSEQDSVVGISYEDESAHTDIDSINLMRVMLTAHVAILLGYIGFEFIETTGLKLPLFVPCLIAAILLSNLVPLILPKIQWPARTPALALVSDYCLSLFLAMSLMSMKLWTLAGLGPSLFSVIVLQVVVATAFIIFIVFRVVGKNYNAAVLSAGFAGFALGATPTAIANMTSVTKRYGPSPLAFIVLPLVSAFFVDLANAFIIGLFV
ncbi:MAG: sodium/glutamate symporter [Rhizobiaceae bacterium]